MGPSPLRQRNAEPLGDDFDHVPNRNLVAPVDSPMDPFAFVPSTTPAGVDVAVAPEGEAPGRIREAGNFDAPFSATSGSAAPTGGATGSARIRNSW